MKNEIKDSEKIADEIVNIMLNNENCEHDNLDVWLRNNPYAEKSISKLTDGDNLKRNIDGFRHAGKSILAEKLKVDIRSRKNKKIFIRLCGVAAALLALSAIVVYTDDREIHQFEDVISYDKTEQNIPIIILPNGEIMDMTKADKRDVEFDSNQVSISDISRVIKPDSTAVKNKINKFIVPNKYTGKLELCDGTVVHLNSNSELCFPTSFDGKLRKVELKGEGYFEVKKSDKMFIVSVNGIDVKVYGTRFNIHSYEKDIIETVLVDGSVGISTDNGHEMKLIPNELCHVNKLHNTISKEIVNVQKYITWTNGTFMYERDPFVTLIRELSRWYGVDFVFLDKELKELSITAIFSKKSELKDILETIEMLNLNIVFTQSEGRYYIKRK